MKYLITEEQNRLLKEEMEQPNFERLTKKFFEKQVSSGEQPHIDKLILNFFDISVWSKQFGILTRMLRNFLGKEQSIKLTEELLQQTFKTDRYNFSGGYSFEFKVKPIDQDDGQMWVEVYILPGGEVTLIHNGETIDLKQALNEEDFGWEVENEVKEIIDEIFTKEITYKTGVSVDMERFFYND